MKTLSICVTAALLAGMSGGAAADCDSSQCNTEAPPQTEVRIVRADGGNCDLTASADVISAA